MSLPYALEKEVAVAAVLRACRLTSAVFEDLVKVRSEKLIKVDDSPVTVGDFAAQAVVNTILEKAYPEDKIVGEEVATDLTKAGNEHVAEMVFTIANEALDADLGLGDNAQWGIGPGSRRGKEEILLAIDRGDYEGGRTGRMWALDPIDGTKGFLRGEQYAVCLALIVDSVVQVGVIGCPNLPQDFSEPNGPKGCLFVAVRGQGAEQRTLLNAKPVPITMPVLSPDQFNFLESVEAAHSSQGFNQQVSEELGITREPTRMDSQAKYCALARGDGGAYLRMPVNPNYREKIWDHAAGSLLVEEAGGKVTDSLGKGLDFGVGRTLGDINGIVGTRVDAHDRVLKAIQKVKEQEKRSTGNDPSQA